MTNSVRCRSERGTGGHEICGNCRRHIAAAHFPSRSEDKEQVGGSGRQAYLHLGPAIEV